MRLNVSKFMLFFILLMLFQPTTANAYKLPVDETMICTNLTRRIEKEFEIKKHLLTTIASVESGKWNHARQQNLSWPWTINAAGRGMYFDSKEEAIEKVRELQAQGVRSIDVGCMQINLMYHPNAFGSLEEAFDPEANVRYGATFLRRHYDTRQDWIKAAMAYHSTTPKKAQAYKRRIVRTFEKVKNDYDALDAKLFAEQKISDEIRQARIENPVRKTVVTATRTGQAQNPNVAGNSNNVRNSNNRAGINANEWREARLREYRASRASQ
jgi:hypothetical protein